MQRLLPLKWQIWKASQTSNQNYFQSVLGQSIPAYAQWVQNVGNGLYNVYVITTGRSSFPTQQCMQNDIWDARVTPQDFFTNVARWPFTSREANMSDGQSLLTTITNITGMALTVTATVLDNQGSVWGSNTRTLPAWGGQISFVSVYIGGNKIQYTIYPQGSKKSVAQFDAHQKHAFGNSATPWVDNTSVSAPFTFSTPVIGSSYVSGQFATGHPGTIGITIGPLAAVASSTLELAEGAPLPAVNPAQVE